MHNFERDVGRFGFQVVVAVEHVANTYKAMVVNANDTRVNADG